MMIDLGLAGMDTDNPLTAWAYIYKCWKNKEPLPDWVMDYLGPVAKKLITMNPETGKHKTEIKNALGFTDCRCFAAYHNKPVEQDWNGKIPEIIEAVEKERAKRPRGERGQELLEEVGRKFGISRSCVEEILSNYKAAQDDMRNE